MPNNASFAGPMANQSLEIEGQNDDKEAAILPADASHGYDYGLTAPGVGTGDDSIIVTESGSCRMSSCNPSEIVDVLTEFSPLGEPIQTEYEEE